MANTDSFIDEVTEEVRNDRLFGLAKKYGWIVAVALIAIVGGTAFFEYQSARAEAEAQKRGDAILAILDEPAADRATAFAAFAADDKSLIAELLAASGNDAADRLQAVAANDDAPAYLQDVARLRLAALPNALPTEEREAVLTDLAAPGALYRTTALDLLVLLHIENANTETAIQLMQDSLLDATADRAQSQRFIELIIALGETPTLAN